MNQYISQQNITEEKKQDIEDTTQENLNQNLIQQINETQNQQSLNTDSEQQNLNNQPNEKNEINTEKRNECSTCGFEKYQQVDIYTQEEEDLKLKQIQTSIGSIEKMKKKKYSFDEGECSYCEKKIMLTRYQDHLLNCQKYIDHQKQMLKNEKFEDQEIKQIQKLEQLVYTEKIQQDIMFEKEEQKNDNEENKTIENQDNNIDDEEDWEDEEYSEEDENDNNGILQINELNNLKRKICKMCDMLLEYQYEDQLEEHLNFMHKIKPLDYRKNKQQYMTNQMTLEEMEERQFELDWEKITDQRKISKNILNQLKKAKYIDVWKQYQDLQGTQQRCCICMCDYENNDILMIPPCEHVFHKECLESWLNKIGDCPKCKQQIEKLVVQQQSQK